MKPRSKERFIISTTRCTTYINAWPEYLADKLDMVCNFKRRTFNLDELVEYIQKMWKRLFDYPVNGCSVFIWLKPINRKWEYERGKNTKWIILSRKTEASALNLNMRTDNLKSSWWTLSNPQRYVTPTNLHAHYFSNSLLLIIMHGL